MGFWRNLFGLPEPPPPHPLSIPIHDAQSALVNALREEVVFLREQVVKANDHIVQMSDPLLEARVVAAEKARSPQTGEPRNNQSTLSHNPRILALQMEARERGAMEVPEPRRDPADIERAFRRTE